MFEVVSQNGESLDSTVLVYLSVKVLKHCNGVSVVENYGPMKNMESFGLKPVSTYCILLSHVSGGDFRIP
jgi:hypothetical protein